MFACDAFAGQLSHAAPAAAALELIHNFSLIHDDIQDRGYERRHQPTVWAVWDTPRALLAGDSMQSLGDFTSIRATDSIDPATAIRVSALVTESYLEMIEGQCRDLQFEQRETIGTDEYLDMIALKTGALIRSSLVVGAVLGTEDSETIEGGRQVRTRPSAVSSRFAMITWASGETMPSPVNPPTAISYKRKKSYPIVYRIPGICRPPPNRIESAILQGNAGRTRR